MIFWFSVNKIKNPSSLYNFFMDTIDDIIPEFKDFGIKRPGAVVTLLNNEDNFFDIWIDHYSKHYDARDIFVLDHNSTGKFAEKLYHGAKEGRYNVIPVHNDKWHFNIWMCTTVSLFQWFLLQSYKTVLVCDCDEIVFTDPKSKYSSLREYYENFEGYGVTTNGYHILCDPLNDLPLDINQKIIKQKQKYIHDDMLCKPILSTMSLQYNFGFHSANNMCFDIDKDLILFHLRMVDLNWNYSRDLKRNIEQWSEIDIYNKIGTHSQPCSKEERIKLLQDYFDRGELIPERFQDVF